MEIKRGDIIYMDCDDSETMAIRPYVIVSNDIGNKFGTIVLGVPLTTKIKKLNQPTHCVIGYNDSMVMAEQIYTIEKAKIHRVADSVDSEDMAKINECLIASLELEVDTYEQSS